MRTTQERIAWTHALNTLEDAPERVVREMQHTAYNQAFLRQQAGNTNACRPTHVTTMTVSLSWDPSQRPDQAMMIAAATSFLEHMGWSQHQALIIGHNDTAHPHCHLLLNRIHPQSGLTLDQNWDRTRASRWAFAYERDNGPVFCLVRELKHARGLKVEGQNLPYRQRKMWRDLGREAIIDPDHSAALRSGEWNTLKPTQKRQRLDFWKQSVDQRRQLRAAIRDEVKAEFKPEWHAYAKQRDARRREAEQFDQATRRALHHHARHGPLHGVDAVQQLKQRQEAYHQQLRHDLFLQRTAINDRMRQRYAELAAPALDKLNQDRARLSRAALQGPGGDRPDLLAGYAANQNRAQLLLPEQIKGYKEHAIQHAARRARYAEARRQVAPRVAQDNRPVDRLREQRDGHRDALIHHYVAQQTVSGRGRDGGGRSARQTRTPHQSRKAIQLAKAAYEAERAATLLALRAEAHSRKAGALSNLAMHYQAKAADLRSRLRGSELADALSALYREQKAAERALGEQLAGEARQRRRSVLRKLQQRRGKRRKLLLEEARAAAKPPPKSQRRRPRKHRKPKPTGPRARR